MLLTNSQNLAVDQGKRLITLREVTHLTRRAFARKHNIPLGSLQNWESGRYKGLSKQAIRQLIHAFSQEGIDCSAEWLLYGIGDMPKQRKENYLSSHDTNHHHDSTQQVQANARIFGLNRDLFQATEAGRSRDVVALIEKGADLHFQKGMDLQIHINDENSLLHIAAWNGHTDVAKVLIEHGAAVDARNRRQQTPLFFAVYKGYREIIDNLLANHADLNALDDQGDPPLEWAVYSGKTEMVAYLLDRHACIDIKNIDGNTAMHWAAYRGFVDIVELLLKAGAKPDIKNNRNETPLDCAINKGHQAIVDLLG